MMFTTYYSFSEVEVTSNRIVVDCLPDTCTQGRRFHEHCGQYENNQRTRTSAMVRSLALAFHFPGINGIATAL